MGTAPINTSSILGEIDAPPCDDPATLDVGELGPPKPLSETLKRLTALDADGVLVQLNDRVPQHLYPRLKDRGFEYETVERDDVIVTAIWHAK